MVGGHMSMLQGVGKVEGCSFRLRFVYISIM